MSGEGRPHVRSNNVTYSPVPSAAGSPAIHPPRTFHIRTPSSSPPLKSTLHISRYKLLALGSLVLLFVWNVPSVNRKLKQGYSVVLQEGALVGKAERYRNSSNVDVFEDITLRAKDDSIRATFIPLGATLTNLWVKDRRGAFTDVVLGYDDREMYWKDPYYASFGPIVGRYANRIKNSTFTMDGKAYHLSPNENGGKDTLHGGFVGTARAGWRVVEKTEDSVTFGLTDRDGTEGFPGTLKYLVSYYLKSGGKWDTVMTAKSVRSATPIMLSSHVYWNLNGYRDSDTALNHTLRIQSHQFIKTDGILIPTGEIGEIEAGSPLDFSVAKQIGAQIDDTLGVCGTGCIGYDTCFIYDKPPLRRPVMADVKMELASKLSGIKLSIRTDQLAAQLYTCGGERGQHVRKAEHGVGTYGKYSCVVLEQQGYIDALNNPQWGQNHIYAAGKEYVWRSQYDFSVF